MRVTSSSLLDNNKTPFSLDGMIVKTNKPLINHFAESCIERLISLRNLERIYQTLPKGCDSKEFVRLALEKLNVNYEIKQDSLAKIPSEGPVIFVSNHPFGALEGLILADMLFSVRNDFKVVANYLLKRIPELEELVISVDPFGNKNTAKANASGVKSALSLLKRNGAIVLFPSGTVSHLQLSKLSISDPKWQAGVAMLAKKTDANIVPIFIEGQNSALFQISSAISNKLRTVMIPRELLNKSNKTIKVNIGKPIKSSSIKDTSDCEQIADFLKQYTYSITSKPPPIKRIPFKRKNIAMEPVRFSVNEKHIIREINSLVPERHLLHEGNYDVFVTHATEIPCGIQEIGRLREITFREIGEGTGKDTDLDQFDNYYEHLILWNRQRHEIAGAYRLARADKIIETYGLKGLYSSTLFQYKPQFFQHMGPSIELGRSFIRSEYQRNYMPLLLLWRGIGRYVRRHEGCSTLFGPVSISNNYNDFSKRLIVKFIKKHYYNRELERLITARAPFSTNLRRKNKEADLSIEFIKTLPQLSNLIKDIEGEGPGIPPLVKNYIKMGGKFCAFHVDKNFNNSLDGLVTVDLRQTAQEKLKRYIES